MATPTRGPPDAAAMKSRIITHMNADHQLSLRLYLQHYSHVPSSGTTKATLEDVTPEHMILNSYYGRHVVPFNPPMKSLTEGRERLVAMHQQCLQALDLSDIVIDTYEAPRTAQTYLVAGLVSLILATFPFRQSLRPESGSLIYQIWSLGGLVPGLASLSYTLAPAVLAVIIVAHVTESAYFARSRLRRHWVETFSRVWWAWLSECLMVGFSTFQNFDALVKRKEDAKGGKGKH